jgi:hypothetical protein
MDSRVRGTRESIHEPSYTGKCLGPPSDWQWRKGKSYASHLWIQVVITNNINKYIYTCMYVCVCVYIYRQSM